MTAGHSDSTVDAFKVFGERNCGTNLASELMRANSDVNVLPGSAPGRVLLVARRLPNPQRERLIDAWHALVSPRTLGWKHAYITDDVAERIRRRDVLALAVVKHPLAWLTSLRRHGYHIVTSDSGLEHRRLRREHLPAPPADVRDVWTVKHRRYVELEDLGIVQTVRFEDLLIDQQATFVRVLERFGLQVPGEIVVPTQDVKGTARSTEEIRSFYAEQRWRAELVDGDLAWLGTVDPELLSRLGYAD